MESVSPVNPGTDHVVVPSTENPLTHAQYTALCEPLCMESMFIVLFVQFICDMLS